MRVSAPLPTGVAALFRKSAGRRRRLEDKLVGHLESVDFEEVVLPVVDYLEPYEAMLDTSSRQELYRFIDRDGEVLALRADFTPMLARLLAPGLASLPLPQKLFYRGDVLRYQEERAGRQREFYQLGGELLGFPGHDGEALVLRHFLELLTIGERRRLLVVVGFAGALDQVLLEQASDGPEAVQATVGAIMRRERRLASSGTLREVIEHGLPEASDALGEKAQGRLERLQALCEGLNAEFPEVELRLDLAEFADQTLAPELAPGLGNRAYYDGLVFRAFAGRAAEPVGAGGRYDSLFHRLGAEVTACGFSLSLDRLMAQDGQAQDGQTDAGETRS